MTILVGGAIPVGAIMQSAYAPQDPNWMLCTGAAIVRSAYPALSLLQSVGVFTPTVQVNVISQMGGMCAISPGGTIVTAPQGSGSAAPAYSTNGGVTWNATTGPGGTNNVISAIAWAGSIAGQGFVSAPIGSNSLGALLPWYSNTTGSIWYNSSGTTGAPFTASTIAGDGAGNVIFMGTGAALPATYNVFRSVNGGSTYSAVTMAFGSSVLSGSQVIYTGSKWIVFGSSEIGGGGNLFGIGYQYSTTGASSTWTSVNNPPWGMGSVTSACTDGAGNILVLVNLVVNSALQPTGCATAWYSKDGGTTWSPSALPGNAVACSYANGRWIVALSFNGDAGVSADLLSWAYVPLFFTYVNTYGALQSVFGSVVYASGKYCAVSQSGVVTLTEDLTKMYLPIPERTLGTSYNYATSPPTPYPTVGNSSLQSWVKVS